MYGGICLPTHLKSEVNLVEYNRQRAKFDDPANFDMAVANVLNFEGMNTKAYYDDVDGHRDIFAAIDDERDDSGDSQTQRRGL